MLRRSSVCCAVTVFLLPAFVSCCKGAPQEDQTNQKPAKVTTRSVADDILAGRWAGPAISYSGYREGQDPDTGVHPTKTQILEDLRILERQWRLIRLYGAGSYAEDVLQVIRDEGINLKVMQGIWLAKEPGNETANGAQVKEGIRLANEYADIVFAVNVGNEVLIHWTAHPVPEEAVIRYIREVKAGVPMPVTLADNYAWWVSDGKKVAAEVDFLTVHSYPVWERRGIEDGLPFTIENIEAVRAAIPDKPLIIGEAGWPSYTEGNLHVPRTGNEANQKRYFEELTKWTKSKNITTFFFEAFDEPWKGTGTEGHWGYFTVGRKAKPVVRHLFPDLLTDGPTSPSYSDSADASSGTKLDVAFTEAVAKRIGSGSVNFHGEGIVRGVAKESGSAVDGATSLRIPFDGRDWGGVYFFLGSLDAGDHDKLVIYMKAPDTVKSFELKLEGPASVSQTVNLMDHVADRRDDGWRVYSVPRAALRPVDFGKLTVLGLWNPRDAAGDYLSGEVLVDGIHFD